jgi:hypothetical protein
MTINGIIMFTLAVSYVKKDFRPEQDESLASAVPPNCMAVPILTTSGRGKASE